jgi:protocatechuate 3,4-dioxygenase beta subunit
VRIDRGEARFVDIVEDAGWTAHVRVLDHDGMPVTGAALEALQERTYVRYYPFERGLQDLHPLTDADGEATFRHVAPGRLRVTARYGTREATVAVDATRPTVSIRLPTPR